MNLNHPEMLSAAPSSIWKRLEESLCRLMLASTMVASAQLPANPSTWNSPTDYDPDVWTYDARWNTWKETHEPYSGPTPLPLWDDDDFIVSWYQYVHIFDHDLRHKHILQPISQQHILAFNLDGSVRMSGLDGGPAQDWTKTGPFRAGSTPYFGSLGQHEMRVAPDGRFFMAAHDSFHGFYGILEFEPGPDQPYSGPHGFTWQTDYREVRRWNGQNGHWFTGLEIVPDATHGYVLWSSDFEGYIHLLKPDLTEIPFEEGGVVTYPDSISALHYDRSTHTVLGGRNKVGALVAAEWDASTRQLVQEFNAPDQNGIEISGITRGPNGTVVAIASSNSVGPNSDPENVPPQARIYQFKADGTFLRCIELPDGFSTSDFDTGSILWAGNAPNLAGPALECPPEQVITCAPASGAIVELVVTVSHPDPAQILTVTLREGGYAVASTDLTLGAAGSTVAFTLEVSPGHHDIAIEVTDGKASATCATSITVHADTSPPAIANAPEDRTIEGPATPVFDPPIFGDSCDSSLAITETDEDLLVSGRELSRTRRTWVATDDAGQSVSVSQTITVVDTTSPVLRNIPADITVAASGPSGAVVNYSPATAEDACSVATIHYSHPAGSLFPVGTTAVTVTASDAVGNAATAVFNITVTGSVALDPARQVDALIAMVKGLPIPSWSKLKALVELIAARLALDFNQPRIATVALLAFESTVNNLEKSRRLSAAQASELVSASRTVRAMLQSTSG
jgi:hypothetical protein